jgi:hypothetical protein
MAADLETRIRELECQVFHPSGYSPTVLAPVVNGIEAREEYARMVAELERLYRMRQTQVAERWRQLAPIGGQRLSTGPLERPEPQERTDSAAIGYDPYAPEETQNWRQR